MNAGKLVRLVKPADEAEAAARFIVVEDNGDRLIIRLVCDMAIPPTELVRPADIVEVEK